MNQLFQNTPKQTFERLLALLSNIAIEVCNIGLLVVSIEIVDNDGRNERLPRSRNAWIK